MEQNTTYVVNLYKQVLQIIVYNVKTIMDYSHNNQELKTIQHNIEQITKTIQKLAGKLKPTTETVELTIKEEKPALPVKVN